jgi:hypothetical protein
MRTIKFKDLWDNYPSDPPCSTKDFKNQCAIRVGAALAKSGVVTTSLVPGSRHCWHHKHSEGHALAAEELAAGLKKVRIRGISPAIEVPGEGFKSKLAGKKGIVFFKDYWMRNADAPDRPTGDHVPIGQDSCRLT